MDYIIFDTLEEGLTALSNTVGEINKELNKYERQGQDLIIDGVLNKLNEHLNAKVYNIYEFNINTRDELLEEIAKVRALKEHRDLKIPYSIYYNEKYSDEFNTRKYFIFKYSEADYAEKIIFEVEKGGYLEGSMEKELSDILIKTAEKLDVEYEVLDLSLNKIKEISGEKSISYYKFYPAEVMATLYDFVETRIMNTCMANRC